MTAFVVMGAVESYFDFSLSENDKWLSPFLLFLLTSWFRENGSAFTVGKQDRHWFLDTLP